MICCYANNLLCSVIYCISARITGLVSVLAFKEALALPGSSDSSPVYGAVCEIGPVQADVPPLSNR